MSLNFTFTVDQLQQILPSNTQASTWFDALNNNLPTYNIDTVLRVAGFLSQCAHESMDFTHLHENLNYSANALLAVWPSHFSSDTVDQYARNPEKIANCAYANRMGNGDEASGDGWKFHGRGPIQITGKSNYIAFSTFLYNDERLLDTPELLESDLDIAVQSACWFWESHSINQFADAGDILNMTKRINGGTIGLDDRTARYNSALQILQGS